MVGCPIPRWGAEGPAMTYLSVLTGDRHVVSWQLIRKFRLCLCA
jgi:hypothetical protein